MAFTTLEQRYNSVSKQIYNRFSASPDQLVVIKPNTNGIFGSKSNIKYDSRLLPLVSTARDIRRVSKFLTSRDGVFFLGKQTLLQTGNSFQETRVYNPLEVLLNTDPFVGRRTIRHEVQSFRDLENRLYSNGYFDGNYINLGGPTVANANIVETFQKKLRDPINLPNAQPIGESIYKNILGDPKNNISYSQEETKPDIIKFIFQTEGVEPIHFRAFLSSLKQNVRPEFNEQRYVGRTERFVTYAGVKRSASLQFNIAAFSENEIDQVWTRINYLTGLAFPRNVSTNGFMTPPLFRLTVGGIYENQPCYIENLDFDFLDESITFDIYKEVSQVINVNMSIILLEKRSKFYDSPFYKITEQIEEQQLQTR